MTRSKKREVLSLQCTRLGISKAKRIGGEEGRSATASFRGLPAVDTSRAKSLQKERKGNFRRFDSGRAKLW